MLSIKDAKVGPRYWEDTGLARRQNIVIEHVGDNGSRKKSSEMIYREVVSGTFGLES